MSRFRVRLLTSKLFQLRVALRQLLADFRPVWVEQAPIVREEMVNQFLSSVHKPISKATRLWRRRRGYSETSPPLQASGGLLASLRGGKGAVELQQQRQLVMGTKLPQAAPNQFGADVKVRHKSDRQKSSGKGRKSTEILYRVTIPARPFIPDGTSETFVSKLSRQMESFLFRLISKRMSSAPKPSEKES